MKNIYAVYSAGGFGREIMPVLKSNYLSDNSEFVFVDDGIQQEQVNGFLVMTYEDFKSVKAASKKIVIAVADSKVREKLANKCESDGIGFVEIVADKALIYLKEPAFGVASGQLAVFYDGNKVIGSAFIQSAK